MKLHLDKSGRVVLPKTLRQRLGLRSGGTFEAVESAEGVLLRPVRHRPSLVERGGFLVHTGEVAQGFDWRQLSHDLETRAAERHSRAIEIQQYSPRA